MPATSTKRHSVRTGHIDCGKEDTLMLPFMNSDYLVLYFTVQFIIMIVSFIEISHSVLSL